jgi:acetone carboxylase gamma subunit
MTEAAEEIDKQTIHDMLDGKVADDRLRDEILPDPKDPERFEKTIEVHQERVEFDERILVPLNDHLYVVAKDGDRVVKGGCGHEFCGVDENWKLACQVRVRESQDETAELFPEWSTPKPDWTFQVREYFCPGCYALVNVSSVPAGYPMYAPFEPDVDTFYEEWLGQEVPE